jgi:DNA-binding LytR/AlgR family response regulator
MEILQRTYSCVVIDDDIHAIEYMRTLINAHPLLTLSKDSNEPLSVLANWTKQRPAPIDFLFLDVEMPGISGLDFARLTREYYDHLIITTSHSRYAIDAYDVRSSQYLLKPFNQEKFINTVQNCIGQAASRSSARNESIFLKSGRENSFVQVKFKDIVMISALEHYSIVQTLSTKYVQHTTLQQIENNLAADGRFLRVNRSFMVSLDHIVSFCGNQLMMSNGENVSIGPTFRNNVLSKLNLF